MAAAHAGVNDLDFLRLHGSVALANLVELLLHLFFLLGLVQIILPSGLQGIIRMPLQPQTAQAVLHHIADNPVRGKELGGGRDFFLGDLDVLLQVSKDLILRLRVVVLVEPANNLHLLLPVFLGDKLNHLLKDAALTKQVLRQQQFRVVLDTLEHPRQNAAQGIALDDKKIAIKFFGVVGVLQLIDLVHVQAVQLKVDCLSQNLGLELPFLIGKHPYMRRQVAIDLHKAKSGKAVEPGIGSLFQDLLVAVFLYLLNQGRTLLLLYSRQQIALNAVRIGVSISISRDAKAECPLGDTLD